MAISDGDVSVNLSGNIRWTGGAVSANQYTVLELHRWLQEKADDAEASGDDLVDITTDTPSERSTDQIITLNAPFNIDDTMAQHLYAGSVTQTGGDDVYSGLQVVGSVNNASTELQLVQNKNHLPDYWGTGLNANAASAILHRQLVKTRTGGTDIDGKRLRVQARYYTDTYAEFSVTLGLGESVAAIFTNEDINNTTALATVAGWTSITNVEGYQQIDLGNGEGEQDYYSQWNRDSYTINQLYERAKWIQSKAPIEDEHTGTGKDNDLGDGTILTQHQSFTVGANTMYLRRARFRLKIGAGAPTGDITATLYAHDGTYGTSSVGTGGVLATSEAVPATRLRSAYDEIEFVFNTPVEMTGGAYYMIGVEFADDVSNYVQVDGVETTGHDGNRADNDGSWNTDDTDDLWFRVDSSLNIHDMPGELFRGITHQWAYDAASGNFTEDEELTWGTDATAGAAVLLADDDNGADGIVWVQLTSGVLPVDPTEITGGSSGETMEIDGAVTSRTLSVCFIGQSTGTALIGAFGIGVEALDLSDSDKLFDLTNQQRVPPNNVVWTISGVVIGEDRILVGPKAAGLDFEYDQLELGVALDGAAETEVACIESIPTDMPASGSLRIELDTGINRRVQYESYTGNTFTLLSTDFTDPADAVSGNNVMVSFIDKLADDTDQLFATIFDSQRELFVRVRDGGGTPIKTYEAPSNLTSAGGSASATRTSDA